MSYRLGCDVGGTFTDLLIIDEASGRAVRDKLPSTPHDPSEAVVAGAKGSSCHQSETQGTHRLSGSGSGR